MATAQALREATDVKLEADYLPHLSLLYSSISKESRLASWQAHHCHTLLGHVHASLVSL